MRVGLQKWRQADDRDAVTLNAKLLTDVQGRELVMHDNRSRALTKEPKATAHPANMVLFPLIREMVSVEVV